MTSPSRNQIFAALYDLTAPLTGPGLPLAWRSRKLKHFAQVPKDQQPCLMQTEHTDKVTQKTGLPYRWAWSASWVLYVPSDPNNDDDVPAIAVNDLLDALEAAITPAGLLQQQTLGGLVHHAYIDGTVMKVPGDDDGQGMIVVPITILVP